jgi:hypothetical protein
MWSRRLITSGSLDAGSVTLRMLGVLFHERLIRPSTQLPYIRKAKALGYGIVVFNYNHPVEVCGPAFFGQRPAPVDARAVRSMT